MRRRGSSLPEGQAPRASPRGARQALLIRSVYAVCLLGATYNHITAVNARGWMPADLPTGTAIYWASLTFLDPIAAMLLFARPKVGIAATSLIIVTDVVHNLAFRAQRPLSGSLVQDVASSPFLLAQMGFLLFVGATVLYAWKRS